MEAEVSFTNEDGTTAAAEDIIVNSAEGPGKNVTVRADENGGYSMSYRLSSNTHSHTVVAQFAMRAGQSVHISPIIMYMNMPPTKTEKQIETTWPKTGRQKLKSRPRERSRAPRKSQMLWKG